MSTVGETDFLRIWATDELNEVKKRLSMMEGNYNTLSGKVSRYKYAHDKMIPARRKVIKIWERVLKDNNYKK